MKEKKEIAEKFNNTMEAILHAREIAEFNLTPSNPQVFEVHFKHLKPYSSHNYRIQFDPNHKDYDYFVYEGGGSWLDKIVGWAKIQKNGKGIVVSDYFFGKKVTATLNNHNMEFIKIVHYDAMVPENFEKVEERVNEALKTENQPSSN